MVYQYWTRTIFFCQVIAGLCFSRLISGSCAGDKNGGSCFTVRNKKPISHEGHVSQYFHRTSCNDSNRISTTIKFYSGKDFTIRNIFANRCLMEGWKCYDNSYCVNMGTSFQCLCYVGFTCSPTEMAATSVLPTSAPKMTVCPGSSSSLPVNWGQSNYCFVPDELSWDTASYECNLAGGHLVVLGSPEENEFLRSTIAEKGSGSNWVGLKYGDGGWTWIDKDEPYLNWGPGQGGTDGGFCARIKDRTGKLHDRACTSTYAYICEEELIDG